MTCSGRASRGAPGSSARFFHQLGYSDADYELAIARGDLAPVEGADPIIYENKADKGDRRGSSHPTVKPVALMQYLIRHITPPGGRVLDPFAGSGTTATAARREGFDCVLIEQDDGYATFLRERFGQELRTPEPDAPAHPVRKRVRPVR